MFLSLNPSNPDTRDIDKVVKTLNNGGIIIYPTDTVYSLGCSLINKKGIAALAKIKNVKPRQANFAIICSSLSNISDYTASIDRPTYKILNRNLPGAFTFILNSNPKVSKYFDSKKKTIGIRIPDNNIIQQIVEALGHPLVTTSIHDEDEILEYSTDPYQINESWGDKVDIIIDGGYGNNVASTVVDLTQSGPEIIRQGIGELDY
ncbi:MAG: threonylcarbamoyl-AMP synthase [Crocinitomicaceae bacterium]|nr:threonylcarbamoyl-AMP synthase [Crocinitomicaceae bacterium]